MVVSRAGEKRLARGRGGQNLGYRLFGTHSWLACVRVEGLRRPRTEPRLSKTR